ncbi:immunity 49 family protein [Streptomyces sp. SP17BM10]|uniref:immunity 49 family protein n=1 Tax=Streptomyces sp. SP17BM10 TaxID=3002530 RepID=UPI002E78B69C|nr:immunity 49 family protein [Streptomyces sp. SP17BM10]
MRGITRHAVDGRRVAEALGLIVERTNHRWYEMWSKGPSPQRMLALRDELLDHVAARTVERAAEAEPSAAVVLRTAAEMALGALSAGCFPDGDQEVLFPLIGEKLTNDDVSFGAVADQAPTARTWLDAFEACLVSKLLWERDRAIGLLLRSDYAPAIRNGVPYSLLTSVSDPADLAAMDALCPYLTEASGHLPRDWPAVTLRKPEPDELAEAAGRLDAVAAPTADQRLLRVLLDDDQHAFEQALAARLVEYRDGLDADPAPRTLLPLGILALAALAVRVHGWALDVRSDYLPGWSPPPRRETDGEAEDPLGSVYLRLVAEESIPAGAREHFGYLRPLATDLLVGIALDSPESVRVLDDRDVALVDRDVLDAAARTNLLDSPITYDTWDLPDGAVLHILGHPDSAFAASKLLVFEEAVRAAGGPPIPPEGVLVVVPNRHNLVFYPLADRHVGEAVNSLARFGLGAYEDGPGSLSPRVFWWRAGTLTSITVLDPESRSLSISPPDELMSIMRRLVHG